MTFPSHVRIVEVSPLYLPIVETDRRKAPDLADFIERLKRAGVRSIAFRQNITNPRLGRASPWRCTRGKAAVAIHDVELLGDALERGPASPVGAQPPAGVTLDVTTSDGFAAATWGISAGARVKACFDQMARLQDGGSVVRFRINVAFGCPYQGIINDDDVTRLAEVLYAHGGSEIVLADTIGVATPRASARLVGKVATSVPRSCLGVRFHDTYGLALTNLFSCLTDGIASVESSLGGVHASASGNYLLTPVATEDVVNLLTGLGIECGVDLPTLIAASHFIAREQGLSPVSRTAMAFRAGGCRT